MMVGVALCAGAAAPGGWWALGQLDAAGQGHAQSGTDAGAVTEAVTESAAEAEAVTDANGEPVTDADAEPVAETDSASASVTGSALCHRPDVPIVRTAACDQGATYPACRWRMPHPAVADHLYIRWRNTENDRWWGRPALVSLVLATARAYTAYYPGEPLAVGDLDAPGPRHETHESGVDVDLYLPGMMAAENTPDGEFPDNYDGRDRLGVRAMRGRVETLARILARCTDGRVRIYYNDWVVARRFRKWAEEKGLESPFGRMMQRHNDLHRFHFHVTIDDSLEPLPADD